MPGSPGKVKKMESELLQRDATLAEILRRLVEAYRPTEVGRHRGRAGSLGMCLELFGSAVGESIEQSRTLLYAA